MRLLASGIAVPLHDTHLGPWVEAANRLCHDAVVVDRILPLIKPGDWVVDGGAAIGDHTIAYLDKVGPEGRVFAFEPNPEALACLAHNCPRAISSGFALWERLEFLEFHIAGENVGSSHLVGNSPDWVSPNGLQTTVLGFPLDLLRLERLDLLKLDVEGTEGRALAGAWKTINALRPVIICELNGPALKMFDSDPALVIDTLKSIGYHAEPLTPGFGLEQSHCDYLFRP